METVSRGFTRSTHRHFEPDQAHVTPPFSLILTEIPQSAIRAVIRNTGCNHDGHSPGLTTPAKEAQVELMQLTYARAKLDPAETRFFEAHGTGTNVGDPIEASAIAEIFAKTR